MVILVCIVAFFVVRPQGWLPSDAAPDKAALSELAGPPRLAFPPVPEPVGQEGLAEEENIIRGTVTAGETLGEVLAASANDAPTQHYVRAAKEVFPVRSFRTGHPYTVVTDPETGRLSRFEYEIDEHKRLVVEGADEPVARVEQIEYSYSLSLVHCVIDDNMFQAVADAGNSRSLPLLLPIFLAQKLTLFMICKKGIALARW